MPSEPKRGDADRARVGIAAVLSAGTRAMGMGAVALVRIAPAIDTLETPGHLLRTRRSPASEWLLAVVGRLTSLDEFVGRVSYSWRAAVRLPDHAALSKPLSGGREAPGGSVPHRFAFLK
jgi:hypothetical protein